MFKCARETIYCRAFACFYRLYKLRTIRVVSDLRIILYQIVKKYQSIFSNKRYAYIFLIITFNIIAQRFLIHFAQDRE